MRGPPGDRGSRRVGGPGATWAPSLGFPAGGGRRHRHEDLGPGAPEPCRPAVLLSTAPRAGGSVSGVPVWETASPPHEECVSRPSLVWTSVSSGFRGSRARAREERGPLLAKSLAPVRGGGAPSEGPGLRRCRPRSRQPTPKATGPRGGGGGRCPAALRAHTVSHTHECLTRGQARRVCTHRLTVTSAPGASGPQHCSEAILQVLGHRAESGALGTSPSTFGGHLGKAENKHKPERKSHRIHLVKMSRAQNTGQNPREPT